MYQCYIFIHHPSVDTWVASTFQLLQIALLWMWVYRYLFKTLLSILLGTYLEMELLDHLVILFLTFWGAVILFFVTAAPFYIPTGSAQGLQFLHIFANTCYFLPFLSFFSLFLSLSLPSFLPFPSFSFDNSNVDEVVRWLSLYESEKAITAWLLFIYSEIV